ncbi:MAG: hypothetical protein WBE34_15380 [Candidatus Nitrosopolaris sp.]
MRQIYLITILILSTIIVSGSIGSMVAYGIIGGSGTSKQRNDACYNAGFSDGRVHPYNQTTYNGCGTNGRAYYEGFLSGCISGQGKDYFSCQKMTSAPTDGDGDDGGGSNGNGGGGGFGGGH